MKKLLLASVCAATMALSISAGAQAAELDEPGFNWEGFYAGAHLGYGWGEARWTTNSGNNRYTHNVDGILGGIQAGYNFQMDSIVFGLEGDFSGTGIDGGTSWVAGGQNAGPRNASVDINWLATIAGRVGMTMDRTLFYAKGGLALAGVDYRHLAAPLVGVRKGDATRTGWMIGAGVEHAFDDAWSAKIEYNYMDFGSKGITMRAAPAPAVSLPVKQHVNVIKVGVNYRF